MTQRLSETLMRSLDSITFNSKCCVMKTGVVASLCIKVFRRYGSLGAICWRYYALQLKVQLRELHINDTKLNCQ